MPDTPKVSASSNQYYGIPVKQPRNFSDYIRSAIFGFKFNSFFGEDDSLKQTFNRVLDFSSPPPNVPLSEEENGYIDINIQKNGNIISKTITEKSTGKVILESTTNISEKLGMTYVKTHIKRYSGNKVYENECDFQYNRELLEDYVINKGTDKNGNIIKHFKNIPDIKKIDEDKRTPEQKKLLQEFDNMVDFAVNSGVEYGVDPTLVIAIIQREVAFQGLNSGVVGKNGKGYMQLTSSPIRDYLGYAGDKKYHTIKENIYGPEMEELLLSRNFNPKDAKTQEQREELYTKIFNYLTENKDPEFNIRLGTLVLRRYLNKSKGDIKTAATNYNGSSDKLAYGEAVTQYHREIKDSVGLVSKYQYRESNIT